MANDVTCPYCGRGLSDAWELFIPGDDADHAEAWANCEKCGKDFVVERVVEVEYRTKEGQNTEPRFCSYCGMPVTVENLAHPYICESRKS